MTSATKILLLEGSPLFELQLQNFLWQHGFFGTQTVPQNTAMDIIHQLNPDVIICANKTEAKFLSLHFSCPIMTVQCCEVQENKNNILFFPAQKEKILQKINSYLSKDFLAEDNKFLLVKQQQKLQKVAIFDILFIESDGNQVRLHTKNGNTYISNSSLIKMKELLPESSFIRIHKKYIIQFPIIESILPSERKVCIQDHILPIGRTFKEDLFSKFQIVN